jgi:hypothetical protein
MKLIYIFIFFTILLFGDIAKSQSLVDNPCNIPSPAGAEWTIGAPCVNVTTAGFTSLFNPGSCNSGAFDDGWAWFTGNGNSVTINFDGGLNDAVIHLFSATAPCSVTELACADNTLSGLETISNIPTVSGQVYFIRIQNWNTNNTITGCLEVATVGPTPTTLTDNPCSLPASSEWTIGDPCIATTTAPFTPLFDPGTCGSGAFDDGWAWYTGTGSQNTITYTADPGIDITLHLFEADLSSGCNVTQVSCVNNFGAGGTETLIGGGTLGQLYFVRIQSVGNNNTATGCLGIVNNPPNCNDNIQNGDETGVDCGGSCPANCPPPTTSSTSTCSNTTNTPVGQVTCSVLGSALFDGLTGLVNFNGNTETGAPSPTPTCGPNWSGSGNYAAWAKFDLDAGITAASLASTFSSNLSGSDDVYLAYYQGINCSSLSYLGCETFLSFTAPSTLTSLPVMVSGLDPNLPLWVLAYSDAPFSFSEVRLNGFAGIVSNTNCASATLASTEGCNVGAVGASFTPPSVVLGAAACSGGVWYSNENTVFYEFTPTAATATLEVDDVNCNGDIGGLAQFGIWESCADVGTYGSSFLGCVVGDGVLSLTGMTIGQTYTVVFDGNAGDLCRWTFVTTGGILLEVDILSLKANYYDGIVHLNWTSGQDKNISYYEIEKSSDAVDFKSLDKIEVLENSSSLVQNYAAIDSEPFEHMNYYRLKYFDNNGIDYNYSPVIAVEVQNSIIPNVSISPNPVTENSILNIDSENNTVAVIEIYNTFGQKVKEMTNMVSIGGNKISLETNDLSKGVYFITVVSNGVRNKLKIIKK